MKITHTGSTPPAITQQTNTGPSPEARARAVAIITQGAPAQLNQNNISAEELSAIKAPSEPQGEVQAQEPTLEAQERQTSTNEAPKEIKETKEDTSSNQYVLLARKEKALRAKAQQQEQAFKAREAELAKRESDLAKIRGDYESGYVSKAQLKANTLAALAEAGVTYEEVTQQQIDAGSVPRAVSDHIARLEARQAKLEKDLEAARQSSEQQQQDSYKAAVNQIQKDAQKLITTDPSFEMIKATGSVKDVVELIEQTFKEDGEILSVEEAASLVEEHLLAEVEKLTRIEKIKKRLAPPPAAKETANAQTPQTKQPQTMKTLTNATSSTRKITARERAVMAFKGELK